MIKFNRDTLKDKIHACWMGKNIGGTMGAPFEGKQQLNDIQGFSTAKGVIIPNDDLDLQLVWLKAIEEKGPYNLNAQILGEYWINYIPPHWNEYGVGKGNMKGGLLPPLSGDYQNDWKDSNGAWIRSEIWACLAPGCPDIAIKYAIEDACVDHSMGEGTYAEIFTASIESAAFITSDIRELIRIGLSKIPENCRIARSINILTEAYDSGVDWKTARNLLVEDSKDLGWFQAPANVAFVVLGMLYGQGDFKKSMIYSINCGDDTDCTGATIGALLGIMHGTKIIPEDWRSYIGDQIVTVAVDRGSCYGLPNTCTELTERVLSLAPVVLKANKSDAMIYDGADCFDEICINDLKKSEIGEELCSRPGKSYSVDFIYARAVVEFLSEPVIEPYGELNLKITFTNQMPDSKHINLRWLLPDGWTVKACMDVYLRGYSPSNKPNGRINSINVTITAGESVQPLNRVILEASCPGRPSVGLIPVTILG